VHVSLCMYLHKLVHAHAHFNFTCLGNSLVYYLIGFNIGINTCRYDFFTLGINPTLDYTPPPKLYPFLSPHMILHRNKNILIPYGYRFLHIRGLRTIILYCKTGYLLYIPHRIPIFAGKVKCACRFVHASD
jgi:hypothetical protein